MRMFRPVACRGIASSALMIACGPPDFAAQGAPAGPSR